MQKAGRALLLVEDDDALREILESYLEDHGYVVHAAADGVEALELIISDGLRPAVIVMDLRLPAMTGWEVLDVLDRDRHLALVPRIVITGDVRHGLAPAARTAVLLKPFASAELMRELRRFAELEA